MLDSRLVVSALRGALLLPLLAALQPAARADVYHAVAAGETLATVATKYRVTTDQLRAANKLQDGDSAALGAMLLRVPTDGNQVSTTNSRKNAAAHVAEGGFGASTLFAAPVTSRVAGTIGKTLMETVREGDTWDAIAMRYRAAGHDVSVDELKRRNNWAELPAPGGTVIVPLGQVSYAAPAQNAFAPRIATNTPAARRTSVAASAQTVPSGTPRALGGGVVASGELDLPFAKDVSSNAAPVFRASSAPRRGALPSRGGFGQMARNAQGGEVRILTPNEEASAPPAASPRVAVNRAAAPSSSIANVAIVTSQGARIRRLPQASAVTLYNCAKGIQLAVLKQSGPWSAVLMSDRSTGWLPTRYLKITSETRDVSFQIATNDPGGRVSSYARNYAGENPMVAQALRWLGTPYRYGGTTRRGIDCSALVQTAFAAQGYRLPRTSAQQSNVGMTVEPANLRAGDRLYFSASGTRVDHTGIYMGDGLFVHASGSGRQVMVSNLFTPRNWNIFVWAKR
ncbi:MAG: C40 family peptidase [Armatimonadetes bacterium]|nr:C40 family peptidase [Armatimonadota bacterium]